jgi:polar amino acid transport system substrate-binding protein
MRGGRILLAHLFLAGAFVAAILAATAYWRDLACRDAVSIETCRAKASQSPQEQKKFYIAAALVPPNMNENRTGREVDIITKALATGDRKPIAGERIQFIVESFARHWFRYQNDKRFDAVATVPGFLELEGYKSKYYIMYRNGIGSFASNDPIDLAHLKGKRVVSFPGALRVIPELKSLKDYFALFIEREHQRDHSEMLIRGQVDAVIADAMIFAHYNEAVLNGRRPFPVFTDTFAPTCYVMVFRNAEYRDVFDSGLEKMVKSGELGRIDERYIQSSGLGTNIHYVGDDGVPRCPSQP